MHNASTLRSNRGGAEVPETFSGETLQLADLLGDQFDCLSVSAREGAVLVTADLRLRQVAAAICTLPAFGLEPLIEEMARQEALVGAQRAEADLTLCELGHSFVGINAHTLLAILRLDDTKALDRFERAARYLGTPNADPSSHIGVAAGFAEIANRELGNDVRTQAAIGIVLTKLVRISRVPLVEVINAFVGLADTPATALYVRDWLRGAPYGVYVAQAKARRALRSGDD